MFMTSDVFMDNCDVLDEFISATPASSRSQKITNIGTNDGPTLARCWQTIVSGPWKKGL